MLNQRTLELSDYPFQRLRDLLAEIEPPKGVDPILMFLGEPQHTPPAIIAETLEKEKAGWAKYPLANGTQPFRAAAYGWLKRRYGLNDGLIDPETQILPLSGSREGLYMISSIVVPEPMGGPRPLALITNPFYQPYVGGAVMAGAEPLYLDATLATGFMPDLFSVDKKTLDRVAIAFVCSPSNPQGSAASLDYLVRAVELARRHNFILCMDECYADIYNGAPPKGVLQACQQLGGGVQNVIAFHTLSKRSSAAGLRSGFVTGDAEVIARFHKIRNYSAAGMPLPILAASAALWADDAHPAENRRLYQAKFDIADRVLGNRYGYRRPDAGFFLWLDVGDGEEATRRLWRDAGVRALPGRYLAKDSADGSNPAQSYIRLALVQQPAVIETALNRVVDVLG